MSSPPASMNTRSSICRISPFDLIRKLMVVYWEIVTVSKLGSLFALSG